MSSTKEIIYDNNNDIQNQNNDTEQYCMDYDKIQCLNCLRKFDASNYGINIQDQTDFNGNEDTFTCEDCYYNLHFPFYQQKYSLLQVKNIQCNTKYEFNMVLNDFYDDDCILGLFLMKDDLINVFKKINTQNYFINISMNGQQVSQEGRNFFIIDSDQIFDKQNTINFECFSFKYNVKGEEILFMNDDEKKNKKPASSQMVVLIFQCKKIRVSKYTSTLYKKKFWNCLNQEPLFQVFLEQQKQYKQIKLNKDKDGTDQIYLKIRNFHSTFPYMYKNEDVQKMNDDAVIQYPAVTYHHQHPFDLRDYCFLNTVNPTWICPICNKHKVFLKEIQLDFYLFALIQTQYLQDTKLSSKIQNVLKNNPLIDLPLFSQLSQYFLNLVHNRKTHNNQYIESDKQKNQQKSQSDNNDLFSKNYQNNNQSQQQNNLQVQKDYQLIKVSDLKEIQLDLDRKLSGNNSQNQLSNYLKSNQSNKNLFQKSISYCDTEQFIQRQQNVNDRIQEKQNFYQNMKKSIIGDVDDRIAQQNKYNIETDEVKEYNYPQKVDQFLSYINQDTDLNLNFEHIKQNEQQVLKEINQYNLNNKSCQENTNNQIQEINHITNTLKNVNIIENSQKNIEEVKNDIENIQTKRTYGRIIPQKVKTCSKNKNEAFNQHNTNNNQIKNNTNDQIICPQSKELLVEILNSNFMEEEKNQNNRVSQNNIEHQPNKQNDNTQNNNQIKNDLINTENRKRKNPFIITLDSDPSIQSSDLTNKETNNSQILITNQTIQSNTQGNKNTEQSKLNQKSYDSINFNLQIEDFTDLQKSKKESNCRQNGFYQETSFLRSPLEIIMLFDSQYSNILNLESTDTSQKYKSLKHLMNNIELGFDLNNIFLEKIFNINIFSSHSLIFNLFNNQLIQSNQYETLYEQLSKCQSIKIFFEFIVYLYNLFTNQKTQPTFFNIISNFFKRTIEAQQKQKQKTNLLQINLSNIDQSTSLKKVLLERLIECFYGISIFKSQIKTKVMDIFQAIILEYTIHMKSDDTDLTNIYHILKNYFQDECVQVQKKIKETLQYQGKQI